MPKDNLAAAGSAGSWNPEQLYAGDRDVHTDAGVSAGVLSMYEVAKRTAGKTITRTADTGSDTGKDYVIVAQPIDGAGKAVPYFDAGHFNAEVLVWPANLDTFDKRKQFFNGTSISVGIPR